MEPYWLIAKFNVSSFLASANGIAKRTINSLPHPIKIAHGNEMLIVLQRLMFKWKGYLSCLLTIRYCFE
jgi:hypothetical protein